MSTLRRTLVVGFLAITCLCAEAAFACPKIGGLIDYNCDQDAKLAFTGDSIVFGVGDTANENQGGYVLRTQEAFHAADVVNLGVPGVTSKRLLTGFKRNLKKKRGITVRKSKDADFVLIQVGVNDYWEGGSPERVITNIKRLVQLLRTELKKDLGIEPVIAICTLTPTLRSFQKPFVDEVNALLLRFSSSSLPVKVRFDNLNSAYISEDGLHPTSSGYDAMAALVDAYIAGDLQTALKKKRVDADADGIYDIFESSRFGTDPTLTDTDGDGVKDGIEVFKRGTDPLDAGSF